MAPAGSARNSYEVHLSASPGELVVEPLRPASRPAAAATADAAAAALAAIAAAAETAAVEPAVEGLVTVQWTQ